MNDLGTLTGGDHSQAFGINNTGEIVGTSNGVAFVYQNGKMTSLGTLGTGRDSVAHAINDLGQVVGYSTYLPPSESGAIHAFLYRNGEMKDLGVLGDPDTDSSYANGINDAGQIVGTSYIGGCCTQHAFLYQNGTMTDLTPGLSGDSYAQGINEAGQIVGSATETGVFLYEHGMLTKLDALPGVAKAGWVLNSTELAINDLGQIVGTGLHDGQSRGYLLSPFPIPELSQRAVLLIGLSLIGIWTMRRIGRSNSMIVDSQRPTATHGGCLLPGWSSLPFSPSK